MLAALSGCEPNIDDRDIEFIDTAEVRRLTVSAETNPKALLLIDPRSHSAFAQGHLPKARNIELADLERDGGRKKWIEAFSEIVVYGNDPGSAVARAVTKRLLHLRYSDVRMYQGGVMEWTKAGFPLETGEEAGSDPVEASPAAEPPKTPQ